jgi:hypothetical protein
MLNLMYLLFGTPILIRLSGLSCCDVMIGTALWFELSVAVTKNYRLLYSSIISIIGV